jgi:peroxiredoxin
MPARGQSWKWLLLAGLVAAVLGCQSKTPDDSEKPKLPSRTKTAKKAGEPTEREDAAAKAEATRREGAQQTAADNEGKTETGPVISGAKETEAPQSTPSLAIPKVALSVADLATSLVKVGDRMPDTRLSDLTGKSQPLLALRGEKLTVVVVWSAQGLSSLEAIRDLSRDVAEPYGKEGVRVVGIAEHGPAEEVKAKSESLGVTFPILLDRDDALLARVTTDKERLPRTYLLDATGKIAWFDVAYSRGTREDLLQAIRKVLGKTE